MLNMTLKDIQKKKKKTPQLCFGTAFLKCKHFVQREELGIYGC